MEDLKPEENDASINKKRREIYALEGEKSKHTVWAVGSAVLAGGAVYAVAKYFKSEHREAVDLAKFVGGGILGFWGLYDGVTSVQDGSQRISQLEEEIEKLL